MNRMPEDASCASSYQVAFQSWFGLEKRTAEALVVLYLSGGEFHPARRLASRLGTTVATIKYHVAQMRGALKTESVDSAPRCGYRLSDEGMAECRAVLWKISEDLRRAV